MFGSEVLEVGIGMALLFLFMSLIATSLRELVEAWTKSRAKDLERGIKELLQDSTTDGLVKRLYEHPLITSLYSGTYVSGGKDLPSYIPSRSFALAALDLVSGPSGDTLSVDGLRTTLAQAEQPNQIHKVVLTALSVAKDDVDSVRTTLESWFDGTMDRVSGWYKRRTTWILFWIGLVSAAALNVDAITVAARLATDRPLRETVVKQAEQVAKSGQPQGTSSPEKDVQAYAAALETIGYPIGWNPLPQGRSCPPDKDGKPACTTTIKWFTILLMPAGWLITALAIMLGAPFWFDVLNKFMVIRSTVKPREKSGEEGSEDRPLASRENPKMTIAFQGASGTTQP